MNELEQARQTFFEESRDMLRQIEDALLALESGTQDPETLNGLFRAAHTIKGSAGLFGFDRIGRFTHEVETVQNERLAAFRKNRDKTAAAKALDRIRNACRKDENVMPALVEAAHDKCTLGEMVQAMADVYGRYSGGPEW